MSNFTELTAQTASSRMQLQSTPVIARALRGDITRALYLAFLTQAYHHVRHTVPLLMTVGSRLQPRHLWLQKELVHYVKEEQGHEEWILSDITAAGGDAGAVRDGAPAIETDAMVAYAYDTVMRRNPVAFFGMVYVLEGTSVALALNAADAIQQSLALPNKAFTYLRSHGSLDQQHIGHLAAIVDRFDTTADLPGVVTCARAMFQLYGDVFRALDSAQSLASAPLLRGGGMKLSSMRVLLTGATGGIGRIMARRLLEEGAHVLLVARDDDALGALLESFSFAADRVHAHIADLTQPGARTLLCEVARQWHGGINVLINNAGVNAFSLYEGLTPQQIDQCVALNVQVPMHLCRDLLPWLTSRESAAIVNVGSVFGSIGFPGYVAYSASKFAMRGFSEALRRELADSNVQVKYLAPRSTRTAMNSAAVEAMNSRLKIAMDSPERVAQELISLLKRRRHSAVVGWPEKLFVKVNAILPGFVDRAVSGQLSIIRTFARRLNGAAIPKELVSK